MFRLRYAMVMEDLDYRPTTSVRAATRMMTVKVANTKCCE